MFEIDWQLSPYVFGPCLFMIALLLYFATKDDDTSEHKPKFKETRQFVYYDPEVDQLFISTQNTIYGARPEFILLYRFRLNHKFEHLVYIGEL